MRIEMIEPYYSEYRKKDGVAFRYIILAIILMFISILFRPAQENPFIFYPLAIGAAYCAWTGTLRKIRAFHTYCDQTNQTSD